jgi:drug/metabolite transporter (DMT)-like permease
MVLSTPYLQGIGTPTNLFSTHHRLIKGYGLVIAATAIWSGNFIVARIIANAVPPVSTTVLRSLVAVILMVPFVIRPFYRELPLIRKHLGYLTLAAFMGLTVCNTAVYVAATTTNALNLTLIAIFSPIFTIVFARIFLRDTLTFRRVIGLIAATAGVILLITGGQVSRLVHLTFARGDLWMLAQASSFAFYTILVRVKPAEISPLPFLFSLFILCIVLLVPLFVYEFAKFEAIDFSWKVIASILYLGIGPSLLAYLFWNESVAIIGPARAAFIYYLLPVLSGFEAVEFLGEPVTAVHVFSGAMILAGVVIATSE